jgi:hypothetical protein
MRHLYLFLTGFLLINLNCKSQNVVSEEEIYELETLKSQTDLEQDFSDREELLEHLRLHPLAINYASQKQLSRIPFLNELQIKNLIIYRKLGGLIISQYELLLVEGFDREVIEKLIPYINFSTDKNNQPVTTSGLLNEGKNNLLIRTSGFNKPRDSTYLGSQTKLLIKYRYDWRNRISAGFTMEKDAGEPLLKKSLNQERGFDFYSGFISLGNLTSKSKIIIGDYHLRFGQGLAIWSGYNIGRTIFAAGYIRKPQGIVQNSSAMETGFMRGAASTITIKQFSLTGFISASPLDARKDSANQIKSLVTDGLHRDSLEMSRRHNTLLISYGGRVAWNFDVSSIGLNFIKGSYSHPFAIPTLLYKKYDLTGKDFQNISIDNRIIMGKVIVSGEVAIDQTADISLIQNLLYQPAYGTTVFISYRNYSVKYNAPFGNCLGESGKPQNEDGLFTGINVLLSPKFTLRAFTDFYHFPWLKYRIDAPSSGSEQQIQLEWKPCKEAFLMLRLTVKDHPLNLPVADTININKVENQHQLNIRISGRVALVSGFMLQSRGEWNQLQKNSGTTEGKLFAQDIIWKDKKDKFGITGRVAFFSSSYDNRFYTYESDHRFSFSTPMLYGDGIRVYLFGKIRFLKNQTLTLKVGSNFKKATANNATDINQTTTTDDGSIVPNTPSGSWSPLEISAQLIIKF